MLRSSLVAAATVAGLTGCIVGGARVYVAASVDTENERQVEAGLTFRLGYTWTKWTGAAFRGEGVVGSDSPYTTRAGVELVHMAERLGMSAALQVHAGVAEPIVGPSAEAALLVPVGDRVVVHDNGLAYLTHDRRTWNLALLGRVGWLHHGGDDDQWRGRFGVGIGLDYGSLQRTVARPGAQPTAPPLHRAK